MTVKSSLALAIALVAIPLLAHAESAVPAIRTAGHGEIEKTTNFLVVTTSKKYRVTVPAVISEGDRLRLSYEKDGKVITEGFPVHSISIRGDRCWVHDSSSNSIEGTLYVQPCRPAQ